MPALLTALVLLIISILGGAVLAKEVKKSGDKGGGPIVNTIAKGMTKGIENAQQNPANDSALKKLGVKGSRAEMKAADGALGGDSQTRKQRSDTIEELIEMSAHMVEHTTKGKKK